jgi:small redox-active disulfide protein 2
MSISHKIEVLGSGCASCKKLHVQTVAAVAKLGLADEVKYSTDLNRIIELGVMQTPVLTVNNVPVITGQVPSVEEIAMTIQQAIG